MRRHVGLTALVALAAVSGVACKSRDMVALRYELKNIDPAALVRVETRVGVDPSDPRRFFADQPYRSVAPGVGYEVSDVDDDGNREVILTHDATLGYKFTKTFVFTLLPPEEGKSPALVVLSRAVGATSNALGTTQPIKAAFGAGAGVDVPIAGETLCGGQVCAADQTCCADKCVRTVMDPSNCGGCGMGCKSNETCTGALCRCAGGSGCTGSSSCCQDGCFDLQNDRQNCGTCGTQCKVGEQCASGVCGCAGGAACGPSQICCAGGCVPGNSCPCGAGPVCTAPNECCNMAMCVDTDTNNAHCGQCNKTCPGALSCANGACRCNGVQVCSPGDKCCPAGCANTENDPANCGLCGRKCQDGETCSGGQCFCGTSVCGLGQLCCGTTCVNRLSDNNNCGVCGNVCGIGELCMGGMCQCNGGGACVGNETCCRPVVPTGPGGGCFDLSNDPQHCGNCTRPCGAGQACQMGNCVNTTCSPACTNMNTCVGTACKCNGGPPCSGSSTCCPTVSCVSLLTDTLNCGSCSHPCNFGDLCCNGTCTPRSNKDCAFCGNDCGQSATCCLCPGQAPFCSSGVCICGGGFDGGPPIDGGLPPPDL